MQFRKTAPNGMKSGVFVSPLKNLPQIIDMERMFCVNKKRQFTFSQQSKEGESTGGSAFSTG